MYMKGGHKTSPGPRRGEKLRVYLSWWASSARMYRTGILMWPFLEKTISSKKFCPFGCYLHCISADKTWKISQIVSVAQLNHKIGDLGSLIVQLRLVHCSVCLMRLKTMAKRSWKSFPSISIRSLSISVNPENCTMEEVELIKTTATEARPCLCPAHVPSQSVHALIVCLSIPSSGVILEDTNTSFTTGSDHCLGTWNKTDHDGDITGRVYTVCRISNQPRPAL
ncbi:uncharacterized protein [Vulpes vulpes]|uniref:Uncharacterized protein n=1 Tax=Vulpes vulpes TaxID=9627 RepID=A0ABM4ZFU7_VULVU